MSDFSAPEIPSPTIRRKRRLTIAGMVAGGCLMLAPLVGVLGTVVGMIRGFAVLGSSGIADPHALSQSIGVTLVSTAVGFFLFPVGVILLTVSIVVYIQLGKPIPPPLDSRT